MTEITSNALSANTFGETYKIMVDDRSYSSWSFYNTLTLEKIELPFIDPIKEHLFNNDVFTLDISNKVTIIHSTVRISENIPAVLVLDGNRSYGRVSKVDNKGNNKLGKLLYKCIPDDVRLPAFLVSYDIKELGFSKVLPNLYVTIKYDLMADSLKHPIGVLTNVLGSVDNLDSFYEYQLYCKSLNASIQKFTKATSSALKDKTHDDIISNIATKYENIEDRTDWKIFTIDPINSTDFDDAFSVKYLSENRVLLSIYISNVTLWLDSLDLWNSFSNRISTIYLPDRKRPMLPTLLSDCLCSLQQDKNRLAFTLDFVIDMREGGIIICHSFRNCLIRVYKNYTYEQPELLRDPNYLTLMDVGKVLTKQFKYLNGLKNSHDVVSYFMILMNFYSATELLQSKNGIFRASTLKDKINVTDLISNIDSSLPEDVQRFIVIWNSSSGQYIDLTKISNLDDLRHELMSLDTYIHITSPIRRLVDLLNMIQFQKNKNMLSLSDKAYAFYEKWLHELDYINVTMRAIRRVQCDCTLLSECVSNPTILEEIYDGYCFDKLERTDGLYQYIVYLPKLKLTSRITLRDSLENYEKKRYKLYLFNDEDNFKKKIRLQLV